jgi:hypothetical protein
MELFLRLYLGGESPDVLTDRLLRAAAGPP